MVFNLAISGLDLQQVLTKLGFTTQLRPSHDSSLWMHSWFESQTLSFQEILNILRESQVEYFIEDEPGLNKSHSKGFPDWVRKQYSWVGEQSQTDSTRLSILCQSVFSLPEPSPCENLRAELDNFASGFVGAPFRWERWQCPGETAGFKVQGHAEGSRKPLVRASIVLRKIAQIFQKYDLGKFHLTTSLRKNTFYQ